MQLQTHPKNRKGFVRIAIKHGFEENDLFDQIANRPGSRLRRLQTAFLKRFSFTLPLFYGRGLFRSAIGLMPHRRPVNVVVGSPLEVAQLSEPIEDQVDCVHGQYMDQLVSLFEAHKHQYGVPAKQHLQFD